MRLSRLVMARLRALFRRDVVAQEIREEMQFHLVMRADEYRRRGLTDENARRTASRCFGNVTLMQERGYDVRGGGVMETVLQDVRYGVRLLARHPGFSLVAVLTLGLGVGLCTTLFSVIDAVVLRPMPYPRPEQMVSLTIETGPPEHRERTAPSASDVRRLRESGRIFSHIGLGRFAGALDQHVAEAPDPEPVLIGEASEDFLEVYDVAPRLGRPIQLEDMRQGAPAVVLLGHRYWVHRFAADQGVLGRTIRLNREPVTIVGVLPEGFYDRLALWRPARAAITRPDARAGATVHGRLRPGLSLDQAARELTENIRQADAVGESVDGDVMVTPLLRPLTTSQISVINLLAAAVGLVLLIACVNVAGLLLARGAMREPELAVRASLGASRARVVRQLLTESLVLSLAATATGVLLAWLSRQALIGLIPLSLPPNSPAELNFTVLGAAAALALTLPLVFGLFPSLRMSRVRLGPVVNRVSRQHGPALSRRGGQLLTAVEVGLAVLLLAGAGLMVRSFARLVSVDLGFDPQSFVMMEVTPVASSPAQRAKYYPQLLQEIQTLPDVASAGGIDQAPLGDVYIRVATSIQGRQLVVKHVLPGYFESLGLYPLEGRFPDEDDRRTGKPAAVLSTSTAKQLFPQGSAVGQSLEVYGVAHYVAGVAPDVRRSARFPADGALYLPYGNPGLSSRLPLTVVVRPTAGAAIPALVTSLHQTARSIGPPVVVQRAGPATDWLGDQVARELDQTLLLSLLGGFALLLTLIGVFSVTAFAVARRTHEIGVRMAFGARPGRVIWETLRDVAWPIATGLAAGLTAAYFATRVIAGFLFETTPTDPSTFVAVTVLLGTSALIAAWLPARRAARVDPVVALRAD
jgi:predicted permease